MIGAARALAKLIGKLRSRLGVALVLALAQSAFLLPIALVVRHLFDHDIPRNDQLAIVAGGLVIAACYAASALANLAGRAYAARVTKGAVGLVRRDLVAKLFRLPMVWHDRHGAGDVHVIVIQDCERIDRMVMSSMSIALPALLAALVLAVVAAIINPLLFAVLVAVLPLMLITARRFARRYKVELDRWHGTASAFSTHTQLLLRAIATIRAAGAETRELARFNDEIDSFVAAGYDSTVTGSRYAVWQSAIATVAGVAVLVVGGLLVGGHELSMGSLIAFYALVALILRQVSAMLSAAPVILEGAVAMRRVTALIETHAPPAYGGDGPITVSGRVELRDVTFSYDGRPAVRDVNLVVEPGEHVAIVGSNGAGKSTLLAVMLGLYRPSSGTVLIDDVPLTELDLAHLRAQLGVVLQDAALFPGTIRDNVTMGTGHVTAQDVERALEFADAAAFVHALPEALSTPLSDSGVGLSGGQRQRIALARALVHRPKLILLDEPTANLHGDVSRRVMENLRQLPWRPTVIVITHDREVASTADRSVRLEDGRVIEDGLAQPRLVSI
jgi:ABC-type bacteriocin/lantibiotic exporter with double-glycine peptidase domain